jgi:hypothetical protein
MQWNSYKASEQTRRDKPVPRGVVAINDTTGAMRIGDGRTLLEDLEDVGASAGGDIVVAGFRAIKYDILAANKIALHTGVVIGQLEQGEWPFNLNIMVETAFNGVGGPTVELECGGVSGVLSQGNWDLTAVDGAAAGGAAASGLKTPACATFPVQQYVAPPGAGVDIVLKATKGDGTQLASTVGLAHVVLTVGAGY